MFPRSCLLLVGCLVAACHAPEPTLDRDAVAALDIPYTAWVSDRLVAAGQLDERQLEALPAAGFRRAVCLRPADEPGTGWEEAAASRVGLDFVRLPIRSAADLTEANARELEAVLQGGEPVLLYCGSANRVGGLLALKWHWLDGVPAAEALERGRAAGMTRTEPKVRERLGL
jgi:uncharacterized protein (TIGR01244 family)